MGLVNILMRILKHWHLIGAALLIVCIAFAFHITVSSNAVQPVAVDKQHRMQIDQDKHDLETPELARNSEYRPIEPVPRILPTAVSFRQKSHQSTAVRKTVDSKRNTHEPDSLGGRALAGVFKYDQSRKPTSDFRQKLLEAAADILAKHIAHFTGICVNRQRFGKEGDGGYDICMDEPFAPKRNDCLVYSFGIHNEWSFDDDVAARFGCKVHSFDPSMKQKDHRRSEKVWFHDLGIWGSDMTNEEGWKLKTLSSIKQQLGHQNRVIDYLKIDVEGAEWPTLQEMLLNNSTNNVKQMIFEIHTPKFKNNSMTVDDYGQIYGDLTALQTQLKFKLYNEKHSNGCCGRFSRLTKIHNRALCCYELFTLTIIFENNL